MAETNATNAEAAPEAEKGPSKAALKKAQKKAEAAAKKAEHAARAALEPKKSLPERPKNTKPADTLAMDVDPMDECFQKGWLKEVYQINDASQNVHTRFPPEPNGFLHIGHAKAIAVNFGFAQHYGGKCYLRYDDTNPSKEEEMFFNSIKEMVEWLGYEPYEVTYSSDHFQRLYDLAEIMIKKDKAYMCFCSQEEMKKQRGGDDPKQKTARYECPHRNQPVDDSLKEFRAMRDGKYEPKSALLRMKQDIVNSGNPQMWDMPAYRLPEKEKNIHHRTKDKWIIYPTYDFTHCLCDSFEEITHSLCTTEFQTARESYSWLIDELRDQLPAVPQQREYGRLNITGTILSKRKIEKLVSLGIVRNWDDPRLYTLASIRRRGIPPGAVRAFVAELGVSPSLSVIQTVKLETTVRKYLERTVPRLMLLLDPVKIVIDDLPADHYEPITLEFMRGDPSMGTHVVPFTNTVYIDRSDFREENDPNFFRLAPGKTVGLLNVPYPIKAKDFTRDASGKVDTIHASYEKPSDPSAKPVKPQAFIQWVAHAPEHKSPIKAEIRIFNPLFKSDNPDSVDGGFLNDINANNQEIYENAMVEAGYQWVKDNAPWPKDHVKKMHGGPWDVRFQGMRVAYFCEDVDSTPEKLVLNRIVSLKEDKEK